jgi:hypothetical protein
MPIPAAGQEPLPATPIAVESPIVPAVVVAEWERRLVELDQWMRDFIAWQRWSEQWRGKREPGWFGARARRQKPDPPPWLARECRDVVERDDLLAEACALLSAWEDDYATATLRGQIATARQQAEEPTKTRWWERVHIDLFWPMTQVSSSVYGVVGMHTTMELTERFQIFVAPGVMLLNLPTERGAREWKPAADWGFSYRLVDFRFPGSERVASLHVNIAKAWLFSRATRFVNTSIDLAGFSITFKKPSGQRP